MNGIDGLLEAPQEQVLFSVGFPFRDLKFYVIVCLSSYNMLYVIVWVPSLSHKGKKLSGKQLSNGPDNDRPGLNLACFSLTELGLL